MVGSAYKTADKTAALTYAANALDVTADSDDQIDIAIAEVAKTLLTNARIQEAGKANPQILSTLVNMTQLISDEAEKMRLEPTSSTRYNIIQYKQPDPSLHYTKG